MVSILLDAGAHVDAATDAGWTALHYAAYRGATEITSCLLKRGANINARLASGDTAAHIACSYGQTGVLSILLDCGANMGLADELGYMPFHYALTNGHESTAVIALDGMLLDSPTFLHDARPLHAAVNMRSLEIVKKLLERKVDTELRDMKWTALNLAAAMGDLDIVEALITAGADVSCSGYEVLTPPSSRKQQHCCPQTSPTTWRKPA